MFTKQIIFTNILLILGFTFLFLAIICGLLFPFATLFLIDDSLKFSDLLNVLLYYLKLSFLYIFFVVFPLSKIVARNWIYTFIGSTLSIIALFVAYGMNAINMIDLRLFSAFLVISVATASLFSYVHEFVNKMSKVFLKKK